MVETRLVNLKRSRGREWVHGSWLAAVSQAIGIIPGTGWRVCQQMSDSTESQHSAPEMCHLCRDRETTEAGFLLVNTRVFPHAPLCDECSMSAEELVSVLEGTDDRQLQFLRDRGLLPSTDENTVADGGRR